MNLNEVRGVGFPFRIGHRGSFVMTGQTVSEQAHIKDNLKNLFNTVQGERVMNPFYGLRGLQLLFNDFNESTRSIAIFKIREAVEIWEPRVSVQDVTITEQQLPSGDLAHIVSVTYSLVDSNVVDTFTTSI